LILCRFFRDLFFWDELAAIVKGTLGLDLKEADFKKIAANIAMTIREFNLREGMSPEDDFLPEFFFKHPVGKSRRVLDKAEFKQLVDDYYELRGFQNKQ